MGDGHEKMRAAIALGLLVCSAWPAAAADVPYPTVTRVEYVLGCMVRNGETGEAMYRCSCVIDRIASEVSLDDYDRIVTILRMRQVPGERTGVFRDTEWINAAMDAFAAVERDASRACFGR
jgi:hypothetical protein